MGANEQMTLPDIRKTEVLNAPIAKVWEAVSTAEGIRGWFMPSDIKPEQGFEFHLDAGPYGKSPCKVTEVDPPNRLSFTWGKDWRVTFELKELTAVQTEFTLIHGGWKSGQATEFGQPHEAVRETMSEGWDKIKQALAKHLGG